MLHRIFQYGRLHPSAVALQGEFTSLSYLALQQAVEQVAQWISTEAPGSSLALAMDNSPAWIVIDLAALSLSLPHVPIPAFFSAEQKRHALADAGVQLLLTDQPESWQALCPEATPFATLEVAEQTVTVLRLPARPHQQEAVKVTYTSGTTGTPKGVCLSATAMWQVAASIAQVTAQSALDRHFCVLPLATLLENVAGVYASLLVGATVVVHGSVQVGFTGSQCAIERLYHGLQHQAATSVILIPELLQALLHYVQAGHAIPSSLRFVAVGGAKVDAGMLETAHQLGLPVYEGYGLSESASVVTLNLPSANRPGSIGQALPHMVLRVDSHGELWVRGANYLGYSGEHGALVRAVQDAEGFIATGDLAHQDADGYWYLHGRKKNMFITSFGRNVSPEWVESALHAAGIAQACLFGESRPFNTAVVVLRHGQTEVQISQLLSQVNARLPDYARVGRWVAAEAAFSPANQQLTANGRLRREHIWQHYQSQIEALYSTHTLKEDV